MSCEPERVTAYVDDALEDGARAAVDGHLGGCPACRDQAAFERALRARLRLLPPVVLGPELEARLRGALRPRHRVAPWVAAMAAGLVLFLPWGRGTVAYLAWELAQDHAHCHSVRSLALPEADAGAGDELDPEVRSMPGAANGLPLVAASVCELRDGSLVVHLQYASDERRVSLFVMGSDRSGGPHEGRVGGNTVRLLRAGGRLVGLVGERVEDLDAFEQAASTT